MKNEDTRVQYTKKALKDAMVGLLREKEIGKITVKELCQQAGINRGTFYLHYGQPNDVLMEIEQEFLTDYLQLFDPYMQQADTGALGRLLEGIFRHRELSTLLLGSHGSPRFQQRIKDTFRSNILGEWQEEFPEYDRADLAFVYEYAIAGSMRVIAWWLENDHGITPEEFGHRLDDLGHYCHLAIREFGRRRA